jgi:hypothetical protein
MHVSVRKNDDNRSPILCLLIPASAFTSPTIATAAAAHSPDSANIARPICFSFATFPALYRYSADALGKPKMYLISLGVVA